MNVKREIRRIIKEALIKEGGRGGIITCQYCLRDSSPGTSRPGSIKHYRKNFKDPKTGHNEAHEHCLVTVLEQTLKELP